LLQCNINISRNTDIIFKEKEMFILNWLDKVFARTSYQDNVEAYICQKQPKNAADVEHAIKEYNYRFLQRNWQ